MTPNIQRILIFHTHLSDACEQPPLGEGASIVELQESILYYHRCADDDAREGRCTGRSDGNVEAVQFLGLCIALYQLPSSFAEPSSQERTNYVRLESSTLVFVPLERRPGKNNGSAGETDVLAVVQVARDGGHPLAIQTSIEDHHALFCLLRGGGILRRLATSLTTQGELYQLLKRIRKAQESIDRTPRTSHSDKSSSAQGVVELQGQVKLLRKRLAISAIRRDLDAHYQDYVDHQGLVQSRNGGAGRCIVETIPKPIALLSATHIHTSSTLALSTIMLQALEAGTLQVLGEHSTRKLLGISTFCHGQLLHAHWLASSMVPHLGLVEDDSRAPVTMNVPDDQVRHLMRYMATYSMKMSLLPPPSSLSSSTSASTSKLGIQTILPSYNYHHHNNDASSTTTVGVPATGHFLPPPPPFMLNATDGESAYFQLSLHGKAWIIPVHLLIQVTTTTTTINTCEEEKITHEHLLGAQAILYQVQQHSFLLFFAIGFRDETADFSLFSTLQQRLNAVVTHSVGDESVTTQLLFDWKEPGQDIIVVDRKQNQLFLFSDRASRRLKVTNHTAANNTTSITRSFLGLPMTRVKKKTPSNRTDSRLKYDTLEWAALGLDCRHFLASHLHLDTLLALDDMMNELALRRRRRHQLPQQNEKGNGDDTATTESRTTGLELCTSMPLGWVYAYSTAHDDKEVYAFFDSSVYVTVADVQSASAKIQEQFFGTKPIDC